MYINVLIFFHEFWKVYGQYYIFNFAISTNFNTCIKNTDKTEITIAIEEKEKLVRDQ